MENERKMKQVVDLKNRKPTAFQTFLNSFIKTDAKTFKEWMWDDVIVPGVKGFILDSLAKVFFENDRYTPYSETRRRSGGQRDYTKYSSKYAYTSSESSRERERRESRRVQDDIPDYRDLPPMTPAEASDVLAQMNAALEDYSSVTVDNFYTLVGYKSTDPIDSQWGWTRDSFKGAGTRRAPRGLVQLVIPDAEKL